MAQTERTWKIEAEGDTVYTKGRDQHDAYCNFVKVFGNIPFELLTFTVVTKLPKGEVAI